MRFGRWAIVSDPFGVLLGSFLLTVWDVRSVLVSDAIAHVGLALCLMCNPPSRCLSSCTGWVNPELMHKYGLEGNAKDAWEKNGGGKFSFKNILGMYGEGGCSARV